MNIDRDEYFERVAEIMQELEAMSYDGDIIAEAQRRTDLEYAIIEVFKKDLYSDGVYKWAYPMAICGRIRDLHPKLHATEPEIVKMCDDYVSKKILACGKYEHGKKYVFNTYNKN